MIRIVYGKAKSGKTHHVYSEICEMARQKSVQSGQSKSGEIVLIVPEQYTLEAEKQLIEHSEMEGFIGIEVVSFKRLAHKIFDEIGQPEGVKISEVGQIMMLRRLFSEAQKDLTVYQSASNKLGFLSKFHDLIKEFKQNRVTPEQLDLVIEAFEAQPLLKNKLKDFNLVFKAYENEKKNVYFDDEDFYNYLLESLPKSKRLKQAHIWIDGFDSYTVQELDILSALTLISENMTVTLCSDGKLEPSFFDHTNTFFKRFVEMAKNNNLGLKTIACERELPSATLKHVAENLLTYPYARAEIETEAIHIFTADSRMDEVEYCAAQIMELVRTGNYRWQDFAVITNDLDGYAMSIKRIFDELELPYFLDAKQQVSNNPLVHFIKSYLRLYSESFTAESMVNFLKTGFFDHETIAISGFELYVKQYGIREKKLRMPFEMSFQDGRSLEAINAVRESIVQAIYPEFKQSKINVRLALQKIFELLIAFKVNEKIDAYVKAFTDASMFNEAQQFAQIWNKTMDLLDQLAELMGDENLSIEALIEVIESGFDAMEVGMLPLNEAQILVGTIDRSKAHPIKVLFFIGVNDGIVPESGNDKQLILDSEKALFSEQGLNLMADSTIFANKEQFNIYFALTRPSEKLYFSYARSDSEGGAMRPSYFISKLTKICSNLKIDDERIKLSQLTYRISSAKGTVKHMAVEMRRLTDGYPVSKAWELAFGWYAENNPELARLLLDGLTHSNVVQKLSHKAIAQVYEMPIKTSVSKLEQYIQCPFKYFVESGLRPIPQKSYELGAPDVGTLFHAALEHFGKTIYEQNLAWNSLSKDKSDLIMDTIIEKITDSDIYNSKFQYRYLINKLKRVSKKAAWILTQQLSSGAFVPTAFEVAFGGEIESVAPIVVELSNGERLLIRGVIDRVDTVEIDGKTFIRIIDYKSGRKTLTLSDIYNGLQMQLLVYLNACLENPHYFKVSDIVPAGAFYFKIDDPFIESTEQVVEIIEDRIASELKLDGFSLEDVRVLKHLDSNLFDKNISNVIQVKIKTDGNFTKDSKLMPRDAFDGMITHVQKTIKQIGDDLLEGHIDISPCKSEGFVSCQYCDYKALCQFDRRFEGNTYRKLKTLSNEEVLDKVRDKVIDKNIDKLEE